MSRPSETPPAKLSGNDRDRDNHNDNNNDNRSASQSPPLSHEARRILLRIAHDSILSALEHRLFLDASPALPELAEPRGVFTTLYLRSNLPGNNQPGNNQRQLRGCVGYAAAVTPLYRAVAETARTAAFEDSRFSPVTKEEAPRLEVSLSVLSRVFPIDPKAVEVGRHGLLITGTTTNKRGLLLPQVPVEHGWDGKMFLEQACRKAGLPLDAWKKTATVEAFTSEVFGDGDVEPRP